MKVPKGYSFVSSDLMANEWLVRDPENQARIYRVKAYSVPTQECGRYTVANIEQVKQAWLITAPTRN